MDEGGLTVHGRTEWIRNTADTVGGKCGTVSERLESGCFLCTYVVFVVALMGNVVEMQRHLFFALESPAYMRV